MLSIVSATLNSEKRIAVLIESLEAQTCKDFHWYVVDGGSKDRTVELVRCAGFADVFVLRDSSLYVALNEAIKRSKNRFYLVLGDDDKLAPDAICTANKSIRNIGDDVDVINFNVLIDGVICSPRGGWLFWRGMQVFSPAHAVGMLIRKDLHFRPNLGLYDSSYSIAADLDFLMRCYREGVTQQYINAVLGEFSTNGVSSSKKFKSLCQWTKIQIRNFPKLRVLIYIRFVVVIVRWALKI